MLEGKLCAHLSTFGSTIDRNSATETTLFNVAKTLQTGPLRLYSSRTNFGGTVSIYYYYMLAVLLIFRQ
jgi:hypothetical protein